MTKLQARLSKKKYKRLCSYIFHYFILPLLSLLFALKCYWEQHTDPFSEGFFESVFTLSIMTFFSWILLMVAIMFFMFLFASLLAAINSIIFGRHT